MACVFALLRLAAAGALAEVLRRRRLAVEVAAEERVRAAAELLPHAPVAPPPAPVAPPLFVVLEGLDGVGKTTAARLLAERLGARVSRTPPDVMRPFRVEFDTNANGARRTAYYEIGNFVAGTEARAARERGESTVCDRYFCSTHAYVMGRAAAAAGGGPEALPPAGDAKWPAWPSTLERPTHMFVLVLPQAERVARLAKRVATSRNDETETAEEAELRQSAALCSSINAAFERLGCVRVSAEGSAEDVVDRIAGLIRGADC